MLCYVMLCYAMLCYVVLYYTILYYIILYYMILCYIILLYYTILHYKYYILTRRSSRMPWRGAAGRAAIGKGQMGSALMGSLHFLFFDRGTFWVLPLSYFYLPKSARAYRFPQSVKINHFCSGPISVDPICPQPRQVPHRRLPA